MKKKKFNKFKLKNNLNSKFENQAWFRDKKQKN